MNFRKNVCNDNYISERDLIINELEGNAGDSKMTHNNKENDIKDYDAFKNLVKRELIKAVDEEDCERLKFILSILELLFQMKEKLGISGEDTQKIVEKEEFKQGESEVLSTLLLEPEKLEEEEIKKEQVSKENETGKNIQVGTDRISEEINGEYVSITREPKFEKKSSKKLPPQRKLVKGLKTPEKAFVFPVIDTLMEFGGTAPRKQVVQIVYEKMKHILNDYDLLPMSYNKYVPRWKDTLHWVKLNLLERGILARGTEKGIWALTDYGKAYYAMHKDELEESKEEQQSTTLKVDGP